jgi:hypothetical protein
MEHALSIYIIILCIFLPGYFSPPGRGEVPGIISITLEEILEIPKLIQILETPTREFCGIYGEERSLTSKFMFNVK